MHGLPRYNVTDSANPSAKLQRIPALKQDPMHGVQHAGQRSAHNVVIDQRNAFRLKIPLVIPVSASSREQIESLGAFRASRLDSIPEVQVAGREPLRPRRVEAGLQVVDG